MLLTQTELTEPPYVWCSLWLASIATDCTNGIYDGGSSYVESKPFWLIFSMSSLWGRHSSFKTWRASSGWQMVRSGHSSLLWFCIHNFINQDCLGTLKLVIILEVVCWQWKQRLKWCGLCSSIICSSQIISQIYYDGIRCVHAPNHSLLFLFFISQQFHFS